MLAECRELLIHVSLQNTSFDIWQWHLDPIVGYFVHGVYDMLTSQEHPHVHPSLELILHKQVPESLYFCVKNAS